jgi:hypothetical protein
MPLMGVKAYARHKGVHQKSVQDAIKRGRITRNTEGLIDSEQADKDWENNRLVAKVPFTAHRPREAPEPELANSTLNFNQARAAKEVFEARLRKIELEERQGNLIQRKAAELEFHNQARITRDAILNIPPRIAALIAGESDVAAVQDLLEIELRTALEHLSQGKFG